MRETEEEQVILVDEQDQVIGYIGKMQAHQEGRLHRAFSVFIFNNADDLLLQRRAMSKYHSAGLWTNTCCSHPRPNETVEEAAIRRTNEEMGIICQPVPLFNFIYKVVLGKGLTEHEFDHVLIAYSEENPQINTSEVMDWKWSAPAEILQDMHLHPDKYTYWFREIFEKVLIARQNISQ